LPRPSSRFYPVGDIIDGFVARGCRYVVAEQNLVDQDGDVFGVGYLVNVQTGAVQPLVDLDRRMRISEWELASWERRLGIRLPRPPK
jgi:hypothetical protein